MKLYLLRHQERNNLNPLFYSQLTHNGLFKSNILKHILHSLNINIIFTSPFIRCIQTITPYCNLTNLKANKEHALYEYMNFKSPIIDLEYNDTHILNDNYKSYIDIKNINHNLYDTKKRILDFKKILLETYKNTDKNILLVTHQSIINLFLEREDFNFPYGLLFDVYNIDNNKVNIINY